MNAHDEWRRLQAWYLRKLKLSVYKALYNCMIGLDSLTVFVQGFIVAIGLQEGSNSCSWYVLTRCYSYR